MRIEIEIKDFWLDSECDIEKALKDHVIHEAVSQITKSIKDKVDMQITLQVQKVLDARLAFVISERIAELVQTGVIIKDKKEISLVEHIKQLFHQNHGWDRPHDIMERIAKKFGEELKAQYNNIFATKIVMGLKEQGMLKDEVVQILLEGKKS